jgi:NtrC-family two-component system sensor histidine kinase KinB
MLEVAHEELERLRTLVEELLDLSKIESGKLEIEFHEVSVPRMLEAAVTPFRTQAEAQSIELLLRVPEELPILRADPNKLTWVVTNLVGNAVRYARSVVEVSADKAGPWVNFYVKDDGEGIPHEQQARVFEKFVQVPGDKHPGGAGLGLAISKEIVKAHRGHIWVESEPGKGTLFIVALPISSSSSSGTT